MDHASFISPYSRFPKNSKVFANFFKRAPEDRGEALVQSAFHFVDTEEGGGGDVIVEAGQYPVLWTFAARSEEHTSELQSLMRISYAVFCLKKKKKATKTTEQNN